jgi:4-aminobutyrate aminotransferase-like enzyme/Ser/Thr protein kinase RdoA (MazF antagonist)
VIDSYHAFIQSNMEYQDVKISILQAKEILVSLFGIHGSLTELPGDVDFNFRVKVDNGYGYILKVSRPLQDSTYLDFQQAILSHLEGHQEISAPQTIRSKKGEFTTEYKDVNGHVRMVRCLTWIPGRLWSNVNPHSNDLRLSLGRECGKLTQALQDFDHPKAHRSFEWDIAASLWTKDHVHLFDSDKKKFVSYFQLLFEQQQKSYKSLRKSVVHNDPNDNNILVSSDILHPKVVAAIDFGDAIYTQTINDLAIACAYAIMHHNDPLEASLPVIKGYHQEFPLQEIELQYLYSCIAMRLVTTVTKSAIGKLNEPDNEYLYISEKPAWDVMYKWSNINPDFAQYSFREACGFLAHPKEEAFKNWAKEQLCSLEELFPSINRKEVFLLDLSVSSTWIGHRSEFNDLDLFQFKIDKLQKKYPNKIIAGGYLEPRPIYTSAAYDKIGNHGRESRTVHLGVDFWLPAYTPVHALFDGEVVVAVNDVGDKEYGGLLILKHQVEDLEFYTLYGHNTPESVMKLKVGERIKKGQKISELGNYPENGNWAPHLHFQIILSLLDYKDDFPGVAYPNQLNVWKSLCLDPNLLFKIENLTSPQIILNQELIDYRKQHLGKGLSLQYKVPIKMVRGDGTWLIDQQGRKYLDTVNNVAHVGHEHPAVVKAGQEQMAVLNTNSRYLHENINELAKELIETLPPELNVLHFVNSGSEANELAIRMAKTMTGQKDFIASEVGYHGNTNICVDISSYKFDGKGGNGAPEHTHIFPLPDAFRGKYQGENSGEKYAEEVQKCIDHVHEQGRDIAAIIIESIISCGGQIDLPDGFLKAAYKAIRNAGGLCIADEVQVGCGRVGKTFWGFQLHDVVPDIVTMGKPLGNGHPIAAVACTEEVADAFANGMEFFNTFGGNPVSCAIATEVIRTVKREKLQENALQIGNYLKQELKRLSKKFPIIGDVRGQGLFLGIELVDADKNPLEAQTTYLANRMKEHGILMSTDGPDHNVLKIKPPMVFTKENADDLIHYLNKILAEDFMTFTSSQGFTIVNP